MKKRKKKNFERALALKTNIIKHNKIIKLPIKDNITFLKTKIINGIPTEIYTSKTNLIENNNLNLQTDDFN